MKLIIALCALFLLDLLAAQLTLFGLATFHVHAGIYGVYLLEAVATGLIGCAVALGNER